MGRQGSVGGPPPQGPVPVLAGLMDGNGCSIGTHNLSYKLRLRQRQRVLSFVFAFPAKRSPLWLCVALGRVPTSFCSCPASKGLQHLVTRRKRNKTLTE